jgi:cyclohexanecarboxylate-CoA ligase
VSGELVDDALAAGARSHPGRAAVVDRGRTITYGELDERVARAAGMLGARGVQPGDVVSFQLPNWWEAAVVHHAAIRIGAISNPIVPIYREREVGFILRQARSRVLVIPDAFRRFDFRAMADRLRDGLPDLRDVLVAGTDAFDRALAEADPVAPAAGRAASDVALLLYTSGTEADPKGVLHSHETLVYECRSIIDLYGLSGEDRVFMPSPVTHITGVLYGLQMPFMLGTSVALLDVWDPARALEIIERERSTMTVAATPFLHGLTHAPELEARDVSSLRILACGGADIPPALIRRARERLGACATRVYGSTECPTVTGTPPDAPEDSHAETDGAPIAPSQLRLVDGELQVRGPDLFLGYLDAALDEGAFTPDGWFRTGDLGTVDDAGRLTITGRAKDVIIRGGENLSAREIEDLLAEHPCVGEAAVVGFPDEVLGERVCAFVVGDGSSPALEELVSFLRGRGVAAQKLPERLRVVDELPRTASGKVQKFVLRAALR